MDETAVHTMTDPAPALDVSTIDAPALSKASTDAPSSLPLEHVEHGAALCVLASGSSGNCSVLITKRGSIRRVTLIDLGLSPRRTFRLLAGLGLRPDQIDDALVTHLDHDHFNPNWLNAMPRHARLRMHVSHARALTIRARTRSMCLADVDNDGAPLTPAHRARIVPFDLEPFALDEHLRIAPMLMTHDDSGVATFRFDFSGPFGSTSAAFCTDMGHATDALADHLLASGGVSVLAIESNYCPRMQLDSDRPIQLKRRIMGGSGHLSNQQALEFIQAVKPREHVVLLHLSRQCNCPNLVANLHAGADYALTITNQVEPTRWIRIAPEPKAARTATPMRPRIRLGIKASDTMPLFA
jgi:phosphoribosyl 1,2-cyclic phosphodiesterase